MFQQVNIFFFIMYLFEKIVVYQSYFKIQFFLLKPLYFNYLKTILESKFGAQTYFRSYRRLNFKNIALVVCQCSFVYHLFMTYK